jgi:Skp family chaperone for outer membrane proteins
MAARAGRAVTAALAALLITALTGALLPAAHAQSGDAFAEPPRIAVIDMQKIMRESEAVQSIQQQIERQRSTYQQRLSQKEQELRQKDQQLSRQRTVLSPEALQKQRRDLEAEVGDLQREAQRSKRQLDKNYSEAMRTVQSEVVGIVQDIASRHDVDLVLGKTNVVIVRPQLEITTRVLDRLNAQLKDVEVTPLQNDR